MTDTSALYLVEIVVYDPNIGTTRTLRYASGLGFVTGPAETPANTYYDGRVKQPLAMTRTMFGERTTRGRSTVGYGDLVLQNGDKELDGFLQYGLDGRAVTVRRGANGAAYPSGFTTDLIGTMQAPEVTQEEVRIKLRDRQAELIVPLQATKYSGAGLGTLEGTSGDLKGKPKPVCYGKVYNVSPPCVETAKLIYQVHDSSGCVVDAAYDRGVSITSGGTYASTTDLLNNGLAPSAGQFKYYTGSEGTYFRLGSAPSGLVTGDLTEGAAASDRTTAQLFKRLLERAGKTSSDYSASDITTLDAAANYVIGYWTDQEAQHAAVLDLVVASVGASWFVDKVGVYRIKQLAAPSGSPTITFTANDLVKPLRRLLSNDPGQGVPSYQTIVRYKQNYTVQAVDLASSVTQARREQLANTWLEAKSTDSTVQTAHPLAPQIIDETLLTVEADAQAEADRRQGLRGVQRDFFELVVPLDSTTAGIDLNDVVGVQHDRYGLSVVGSTTDASLFAVLGVAPDAEKRTITLTVWGQAPGVANGIEDTNDGGFYTYITTDAGDYAVTA